MQRFSVLLLSAGLLILPFSILADTPAPQPIFNGRDLTGWIQMHGGEWAIEDGVLIGKNGTNWSTNPEVSGSWLRTAQEYSDFVLELEYAISARGNSGIHFRAGLEKNPSFTGYEMQIVDDVGGQARKTGTGSIYDVVAPTRNMSKPAGEWNKVRIVCQGDRIQITLNGENIVDYVGKRSNRGYIGLQNHDNRCTVKFRNIRLAQLN